MLYLKDEKKVNELLDICEKCTKDEVECDTCKITKDIEILDIKIDRKINNINNVLMILNTILVVAYVGRVLINQVISYPIFVDNIITVIIAKAYIPIILETSRYLITIILPIVLIYCSLSAFKNILEVSKRKRYIILFATISLYILSVVTFFVLTNANSTQIISALLSNFKLWLLPSLAAYLNIMTGKE